MNTFVADIITMITQIPVIINEPFTQELTIEGSTKLKNFRTRPLNGSDEMYLCPWNPFPFTNFLSENISEYAYYNNRLDISVQRVRSINCTMNLCEDGKNTTTIRIFYYNFLDINECAERCASGVFFLVRVFLYFSISCKIRLIIKRL